MKTWRTLSILLLLVNGVGALGGGWLLMTDPTGGKLHMPFHWIQNTPFKDYFIPGLILFISNGLFSCEVALFTILKRKRYPKYIFIQGCILTGWIVAQVFILKMIYFLHFILFGIGLLLIIFGKLIESKNNKEGSSLQNQANGV